MCVRACVCVCATAGEVSGVGGGGSSQRFDVQRMVSMDVPTGGTMTLPLQFNLTDDPGTVAHGFIAENGLSGDNFEQVAALCVCCCD